MSHLYDTSEPNAVSEALLRQCVAEQGPDGEAGRLAKHEGLDFSEVTQLRLDFQNVLRIENLWQFTSLTKLQLDNNILEEISGLESLQQLQWLDLSFNNIETIAGLEQLVNLRDLSLANNRISKIENLDSLASLQVLSLANNLIAELNNVKYLRPFRSLQTLALKGNPVASQDDYQHLVVAFVPSLVYLDFQRILEEERADAKERFQEQLVELELHERDEQRQAQQLRERNELEQSYQDAYVDGLSGSVLYEAMFVEDTEAERIKKLPGVSEMLEKFQEGFVQSCEHLIKVGLQEKAKRDRELASFKSAHLAASTRSQERSVERVKAFEPLKQKQLTGGSKSGLAELKGAVEELQHDLMRHEMQLVEQLDEIIKEFELNYSDMVGGFMEQVQAHMTRLRELEGAHHESVSEIGLDLLERFTKNQLDDDELHDDLRILFVDKDTLVSALNSAHDVHNLAVDNKEDSIAQRSKRDLNSLLEELQEQELKRNRRKVIEIEQFIEQQRYDIESSELAASQ